MAIGIEFSCSAMATTPLAFTNVTATPSTNVTVPNGTVAVTVSGGVPPYTFALNALPPTSQTPTTALWTGLGAGAMPEVTIEDSASPQNIIRLDLLITDGTTIMVNGITLKQPSCLGSKDGSLNFSTLGSTGVPITFILTNESGTVNVTQTNNGLFTNLPADTVPNDSGYTLLAMAAGNSAEVDVPLAQPLTNLALITASGAPTCFNGSNGTLTAVVSGGVPPYTVTLSTGQTLSGSTSPSTLVFTGLTSGTYGVTVKDNNGCSVTVSQIVPPSIIPPIVISTKITGQDIVNNTLGSIVATVTGGTPPYTVTLTPGNQPAQTGTAGQALTFSNLTANTYTLTVVDSTGCTVTDSVVVPCVRGPSTNPITNFITVLCAGGCVIPN